jgi:hypothetical protein
MVGAQSATGRRRNGGFWSRDVEKPTLRLSAAVAAIDPNCDVRGGRRLSLKQTFAQLDHRRLYANSGTYAPLGRFRYAGI